jgi:hypothetical protein
MRPDGAEGAAQLVVTFRVRSLAEVLSPHPDRQKDATHAMF